MLYVETLIGRDTVNTMPTKTLEAFKDHGKVAPSLTEDIDKAKGVLEAQDRLGLGLQAITVKLVVEGVASFTEAFDKLLGAVGSKRAEILGKAA